MVLIFLIGLFWCSVSFANEKQIEYCADKLYNDWKFKANSGMKSSMRAHRYLRELYKDWKALAKLEKNIGKYRVQIKKDNDEMLEFLSKSFDEKKNKTMWYRWQIEKCEEKKLKNPKLFKKYWDDPIEIRQLEDW